MIDVLPETQAGGARRAVVLVAVAALHFLVAAVLLQQPGAVRVLAPPILALRIVPTVPDLTPPPLIRPGLQPPPAVPLPDFAIAAAPPVLPQSVARIARAPVTASHFGAAFGDNGFGLAIAAASGGGAGSRMSLAEFEAQVRQRVLAHKYQPGLAWDRRNTCVVNYTVTVTPSGAIGSLAIAPCAVPEINQAARDAIRAAAPFSPPPLLGAADYAVHGSLIFRP